MEGALAAVPVSVSNLLEPRILQPRQCRQQNQHGCGEQRDARDARPADGHSRQSSMRKCAENRPKLAFYIVNKMLAEALRPNSCRARNLLVERAASDVKRPRREGFIEWSSPL